MLKLFPQIYTEKFIIFPKIVTKTVYIRKLIKLFRFHMNPQKIFPLWITGSFCFVFIKLFIVCKVWTLSGKVLKRLHKYERSINVFDETLPIVVILVSGKMPPGKKPPGKKPPRKLPPRKLPPGNMPPRKIALWKIAPRKLVLLHFLLRLTLSSSCLFSNFLW